MSTETNGQPVPAGLRAPGPQGATPHGATPQAARKGGRFNRFKPYLAPILISCILVGGSLEFGVFEGHGGTAVAIATAILAEIALSLFATGRWPHMASAYITGISVGILVRSPLLWPYIMCSLLSISSKYALRVGGRHLWNPSNLGVSVLLFLVPTEVAPLSQQWGNTFWVLLTIFGLGALILYSLGRLHITLTYIIAFSLLSFVRSGVSGRELINEITLLTAPAYQLFMFFMITDPKTTPRTRPRQIAVTIIVAVVETLFRINGEIHAPYYALFWVFPVTNLLEILWDAHWARKAKRAAVAAEEANQPAPAAAFAAGTPPGA
jgi:Na+-translocating ferredoxin:NAD+ oxidoreductase RnfD subunit